MDWRLRRATEADAPALALVATASFLETFAGVLPGPDIVEHCARNSSAERFREWARDPGSRLFMAEHPDGAAPVGYTLLTAPDLPVPTGPRDVELKRIYTLALAAGTGLGARLMAQGVADAGEMGRSRILLGVYGGNRRAQVFYERQGFIAVGTRRFNVGQGWYDDLVYARDL